MAIDYFAMLMILSRASAITITGSKDLNDGSSIGQQLIEEEVFAGRS
jgi:hypothetical protein